VPQNANVAAQQRNVVVQMLNVVARWYNVAHHTNNEVPRTYNVACTMANVARWFYCSIHFTPIGNVMASLPVRQTGNEAIYFVCK
jgi:hypothetical protein